MTATHSPLEIQAWQSGVDAQDTERRVAWLERQITAAERAIAAQRRLIEHDGELFAYQLSLSGLERELAALESELGSILAQRETETIEFALDGSRYDGHKAPAMVVAELIGTLQKLFSRIGQSIRYAKQTRAIPNDIINHCQFEVAAFYPSSFGIKLVAQTKPDLIGHSLATAALEAIFELINDDQPVEQAARVGTFAIRKYRDLINILLEAGATPKVKWRTPAGETRTWNVDRPSLLTLANRLAQLSHSEPVTREATGILTGASLRRRRFEFNAPTELITGTAPKELAPQITTCFGKLCTIIYSEMSYIDEATEQEKKSRTLLDVRLVRKADGK
ncbi:hypothetical protein AB4Z27_27990 [Cupriavidus sp. KB_39]|uniref:hypothetical protein n=1 Tax=Cupriavidus sp. KB_39 TaxID=3233036 RepID=UPI003F8DFD02